MGKLKNKPTASASEGALSASQFASEDKKLTELMNVLRSLGLESLDMPIPVIAIMGSQSAGKSSIVNAISGVTFPRASGTCTRCPMECRMVRRELGNWRCQIKLRREVNDKDGSAVIDKEQLEVSFGPVITDPTKVEEVLRRAQLAILNPSVESDKFLELDLTNLEGGELPCGSDKQYSFTPNLVILDIEGPEVLNLTFIDLPGLIQSARSGEDENSPKIIKDLSIKFIKKTSTIILLAVSMETELENQEALKLAKQFDPEGERTIGLLTKPDIVRETTYQQWIPLIRNEKKTLTHGWFVVKNPDVKSGAGAPSSSETRVQEAAYFQGFPSDIYWQHVGPGFENRLGIPNLTVKLSQVLGLLNRKALPTIRTRIVEGLNKTKSEIGCLQPALKGDPTVAVLSLITNFTTACERSLGGDSSAGEKGFAQSRNRFWMDFSVAIRKSAPQFSPFKKTDESPSNFEEPSFLLDRLAFNDEEEPEAPHERLDLDDVKLLELNAITNELPGNVPFAVKRDLMIHSMRSWETLTNTCLTSVTELLKSSILDLVDDHFGYYQVGQFGSLIKSTVLDLLEKLISDTENLLIIFRALDSTIYTQNDHYLADYTKKFSTHYAHQRQTVTPHYRTSAETADAITMLRSLGIAVKDGELDQTIAKLKQVDNPDEFQSVIAIMADVRAYFQVAFKRTIDNVPRAIQNRLIDAFKAKIRDALLETIKPSGEGSSDRCSRFLQEDSTVIYKRAELLARESKLHEASLKVASF